jgi:hypothetical protein
VNEAGWDTWCLCIPLNISRTPMVDPNDKREYSLFNSKWSYTDQLGLKEKQKHQKDYQIVQQK